MPCWVEGAALAVAFSHYVVLMIAGGEIVHSAMMSICRCCPVVNSVIMMHIWSIFFVQYSLPLLILLKFPTWSYIILSRRHCQVPQVHDIEMFFLLFGWFPNHVGVVYVPMEKILGDNPISVFCSVCQTTIYTGLPLHRNMSSHIIIKWEKCLLFFTKNSINHLLYTLRGFHKILNLFV